MTPTKQEQRPDPSIPSASYLEMAPRWSLIDHLLGGTEAMRAAGEEHLPRHQEETDIGYQDRLNSAVLLNMVEHTLKTLVGKPFSEPMKVSDDLPEQIKALLDDIDLQGNNLDVFCKNWFSDSLAKCFSHVLVEFPRKPQVKEGEVLTKEHEQELKLRPYLVHIKPEQLIAARCEVINGVETLTHVRIMEEYCEISADGLTEESKRRIRVLERGTVQLWDEVKVKGKVVWNKGEGWTVDLGVIPLVTYYTNRKGFMLGKPQLLDLAHLNVAHWQSTGDQRHILTVCRFPILACSGAGGEGEDDSDAITIGPNKVLFNKDPQGRFYYVEHGGASIEAGRKDLQDLESQMAGYGAEFLKSRPGTETATAAAIDSAESTSDLSAMVKTFADCVANVFYHISQWLGLGLDSAGTVEIESDWDVTDLSGPSLGILQTARKDKDLSRKAFMKALQSYGVLPEDYDADEDAEALLDEAFRNMTPQEMQILLAHLQGKGIAFSEYRDIMTKAGYATLTAAEAQDEIDNTISYTPPVLGGFQQPPGRQMLPPAEKPPVEEPPAEKPPVGEPKPTTEE